MHCCDKINISRGQIIATFENQKFDVVIDFCSSCGSKKATSHIKEHKMKVNEFLGERAGSQLRAELYSDSSGYNIKYFINNVHQTTESFAGKSIHYVEDAAHNWISGIKVLNG
jgi:hypothetical protein